MNDFFLLDTNVLSEFARPLPNPRVISWVESRNNHFVSVISLGELRKGFSLLPAGKRRATLEDWFDEALLEMLADHVLPITHVIADRWGVLSAHRQRLGSPLALADGLIAATALHHSLTVVTRNTKDFAALDVSLLNPWEPN